MGVRNSLINKYLNCPIKTELVFFTANWVFMGHEEIFILILIGQILHLKMKVIFPHYKCRGIIFGNQEHLPKTFMSSYVWPLQYMQIEKLPLSFEFKKSNKIQFGMPDINHYSIEDIDIVGGSIKMGPFLKANK